jgi:hypothetical protein
VAAVALEPIGSSFLEHGCYEEAILCAADLIELAFLPWGDDACHLLARQLLEACEERIALTGPFGTALSALRLLHTNVTAGVPFSEAAQPLLRLIPSTYRFPIARLASLVPGDGSGEPHGNRMEEPLAQG